MKRTEKLKIGLQYWLPQHLLSRLLGKLAGLSMGWLTTQVIRLFARHYKVNFQEAAHPQPEHYKTFNDFFTRALAEGARPIHQKEGGYVFPADACISQCGTIEQGQILQAKNHHFSLQELIGGSESLASEFEGGSFATFYLSPKDYHRVHMPCDGELKKTIYIPGDLFSVNPLTTEHVPNLFARNERVVCLFDTAQGPMIQILVGATIVGSMSLSWRGVVAPGYRGGPRPV